MLYVRFMVLTKWALNTGQKFKLSWPPLSHKMLFYKMPYVKMKSLKTTTILLPTYIVASHMCIVSPIRRTEGLEGQSRLSKPDNKLLKSDPKVMRTFHWWPVRIGWEHSHKDWSATRPEKKAYSQQSTAVPNWSQWPLHLLEKSMKARTSMDVVETCCCNCRRRVVCQTRSLDTMPFHCTSVELARTI